MRESYRFKVTGRVQGVYFRQSTRTYALNLGLNGWVRNRMDGAVEGLVSGSDSAALQQFRSWLAHGPTRAQVASVEWNQSAETTEPGFAVLD